MKSLKITPLLSLVLLLNGLTASAVGLKDTLMLALQQDQQHRIELKHLKTQQKNAPLIKQLEQAQNQLDHDNLILLNHVINQLGHWPGANDVGENAAKIALILFKRSNIEQQTQYLPMILTEVKKNNIPAIWYADLYDQHQMLQNLPQRYGQLMVEPTRGGSQSLYPITSIKEVNRHRTELGLQPLNMMLGAQNKLLRQTFDDSKPFELSSADKLMKMAELALACIDLTYPNSIKHVLNDNNDAQTPDRLYPTFFGCFDWHSSVHGHWLLARAAKLFPNDKKTTLFIERLSAHLTAENLQQELAYFQQPGRAGFERPYGLAWFLQLYAELYDWKLPVAQQWLQNMTPLKNHVVEQLSNWIPKLAYPIRSGEHSQTAFAFGLAHDYAQTTHDETFLALLNKHSKRLYLNDSNCPTDYEPSGHDFLSPCLAEADLMRRVMPSKQYSRWLKKFLPKIKHGTRWLPVAQVTDRTDGKLAHLDGLNIARAWMLEGIAAALPPTDNRRAIIMRLAKKHAQSGLAAVTGEHYAGGHWLGSFATYYLTQRGINDQPAKTNNPLPKK